MSITFLHLPDEILHQIFVILAVRDLYAHGRVPSSGNSRPSLCALALVNRRISRIAQGIILKLLDFRPRPVGTHLKRTHWDVMELFNRAWHENIKVLNELDYVEVDCGPGDENSYVLDDLMHGLSKSPMYRFEINFSAASHISDRCAQLIHREPGAFSALKWLRICSQGKVYEPELSANELFAISHLPALRGLSLGISVGPCSQKANQPATFDGSEVQLPTRLSSLNRMDIFSTVGWRFIHEDALRLVLSCSGHLERLTIPLPWSEAELPNAESRFEVWHKIQNATSRLTSLSDILLLVRKSLRDLTLLDWRPLWWTSDIDPHLTNQVVLERPINICQLQQLTHVSVSVNLISGKPVYHLPCNPKSQFLKLLPKSLRFLELKYHSIQGFMYQSSHLEQLGRWFSRDKSQNKRNFEKEAIGFFDNLWLQELNHADAVRTRLGWLLKSIETAQDILPNLRGIALEEDLWEGLKCRRFRPRHYLSKLGKPSHISVDLRYRVPENWGPPDVWLGAASTTTLSNLPGTIMLQIIRLLDQEDVSDCEKGNIKRPSLFALSLTNQRMAKFANLLLYSDIQFRVLDLTSETDLLGIRIVDRFWKSIRMNSSILDRMDKFKVEAPTDILWMIVPDLADSKTLRELTMTVPLYEKFKSFLADLIQNPQGRFTALETLRIYASRCTLPVNQLLQLCRLPSLKLVVTDVTLTSPSEDPTYQMPDFETVDITSLFLLALTLHEDVLQFMLLRTPKLEALSIFFPWSTTTCEGGVPIWENEGKSITMSTSTKLSQLLAPVSQSLTELYIRDWRTEHGFDKRLIPEPHTDSDTGFIDLSGFHKLAVVRMGVHLLSGLSKITSPCNPARGVHRFLPSSLRHISLLYGGFQGIFYEAKHFEQFKQLCLSSDELLEDRAKPLFSEFAGEKTHNLEQVRKSLDWFFDLLAQNEALPQLGSISLVEIFWDRLCFFDHWTTKLFPALFQDLRQEIVIVSRSLVVQPEYRVYPAPFQSIS